MELITTISPTETMMDGDLNRYLDVGNSALRAIKKVAPVISPRNILDLPSGHGRVARHLRHQYPDAALYVADLDEVGAAFCARTFNAKILTSTPDFDDINFGRTFDLIWVGSLLTHLPQTASERFLQFLRRHLAIGGTACVTSHGALVAGRVMQAGWTGESVYGCTPESEAAMLQFYLSRGYGYAAYSHDPNYGISIVSREWWEAAAPRNGLRLEQYAEHVWDNHQDVLALSLEGIR